MDRALRMRLLKRRNNGQQQVDDRNWHWQRRSLDTVTQVDPAYKLLHHEESMFRIFTNIEKLRDMVRSQ